jgi:hypothetical protein
VSQTTQAILSKIKSNHDIIGREFLLFRRAEEEGHQMRRKNREVESRARTVRRSVFR